ncbi:PD-(D/E)XK nuclease family protein [Deinococcus sp. YIM 134068]|uniref:PD-(D/E)XK nuclease family protein n=1 Tax=Deinococcus lichenicola TaxID=3118910 RepID=UPI002F92E6D6
MLIVPDLALYAPELEAVAFDLGVTLDLPLERSIADTRLGAWLAELFRVLGGDWRGPGVRRVLGHPLARDVTPALVQAASRTRARSREAWLELGLPGWLRAWPEEATYEQYAELLFNILESLDPQRLAQDDSRAGQQLMNEVDELTAQTQVVSLRDFAVQVLRLLQDSLPPQPAQGWPVRTPETAAGRFDHVVILGLSEGLLPAPPANPPMLDFYDRQQLQQEGVRCLTALDAVNARDLAFWNALGTARQSLRLSWPQRLGKRQQQPGVYLVRLGHALPELNQAGQEEPDGAASVSPPDSPTTETGKIGQSLLLETYTFSATQLTRFSQCPYRWYAQHALGLNEREENSAHLLPQERGRFNHRVLELVGRAAKNQPQPRDAMLSSFPIAFEQAEAEQGLTRRSAWPQQRPELRRRLQRALSSPDFIRDGATVVGVERAFDVQWNGLRVTGKIDRIDCLDGELFITDYKSGSSPQGGSRSARDVQMNLYLDVIATLHPDMRVAAGQYLSLGNTERRVLGRVQHQPGVLDELVGELREAAGAGFFPARPGSYCAACPLPPLCRQSARSGEDA